MSQKKNIFLLSLIVVLLGHMAMHLLFRSKPILKQPMVISHRGAAGLAPENTLAAIREGVNRQADYVEVDVQRSADNVLILLHDESVDRTTNGTGAVRELNWPDISELDAGSYFSAKFTGEQVPSLESALEITKVTSTTLVLEVKSSQLYPEIEQQIVTSLKNANTDHQVMVISFNYSSLESINDLAPDVPLGLIWQWPWTPNEAKPRMIKVVDLFWPTVILNPFLVNKLHAQGYQVWVWTVNNPQLMRLLLWLGVDGITTDRPDLWRDVTSAV